MSEQYETTALAQTRAARQAAAQSGAVHLADALTKARSSLNFQIESINAARQAGLEFNICAGRQQLLFTPEGKEFCRREILPYLPKEAGMDHIKLAVHLANTLEEPIQTPEQLRAVTRELQQMFALTGMVEAPRRRELQTAHGRNFFADLTNSICGVPPLFRRLEEEEPMTVWPRNKLEEFLETVKPIKEIISRAEQMYLGNE